VKELKKLNHSAIFNFLDLVHVLSTSPGEVTHHWNLPLIGVPEEPYPGNTGTED
jgi:hypothetical protein